MQREAAHRADVSVAVVVLFASLPIANRCLAEVKRQYSAQTWGELRVRPLGEHAELEVPASVWPQIRQTVGQYGGKRV
jgi:hypothetical protein